MHITSLRKVGGSIMLAVPPALLDVLDLDVGAKVGLGVHNGCLIVEPQVRRRYTLEELLAQCDISADFTPDEKEWFDAKPIGEELF